MRSPRLHFQVHTFQGVQLLSKFFDRFISMQQVN